MMKFTDERAKRIAEATTEIETLKGQLTSATSADMPALLEALRLAVDRKEAALSMPEHSYECLLCPLKDGEHKRFESVARTVLEVRALVPHDSEGSPVDEQHFRTDPVFIMICPGCMTKKKVRAYFTQRWRRNPE